MRLFFLTSISAVLTCSTTVAQVSLATAPTITFSNATGFGDNMAQDGEGGSVSITDFDLIVTPIDIAGVTLTDDPLEYHDDNDWTDYPPLITYGGTNTLYAWSIRSVASVNFSLLSVDFNDWGFANGDLFKIEAYEGGVLIGSFSFAGNTDFTTYTTLSQTSGDPDFKLPSVFRNVDEVRILRDDEAGSFIGINNIRVGPMNFTLPLRLLSFSAQLETNAVRLAWNTVEETNVSHFEIERSSDGRTFGKIGLVPASLNGAGEYSYIDHTAPAPIRYYRLRMLDKDASFRHSRTLMVRNHPTGQLQVSPNPATSALQVSIPKLDAGNTIIRMLNMQGISVSATVLNNRGHATTLSLDVSALRPGRYVIEIVPANGIKLQTSFIKM